MSEENAKLNIAFIHPDLGIGKKNKTKMTAKIAQEHNKIRFENRWRRAISR
jgi:hypothetical protein